MKLTRNDIAQLYLRNAEDLTDYLFGRVGDSQAAIDLLGETFAAAIRGRRRFRGKSLDDGRGWLFGIASNLAAQYHRDGFAERRMMVKLGMERPVLESHEEALVEIADLELTVDRVNRVIGQLKHEYREAIEMRLLNDRSYTDMAKSLGVSEDVARARVSRGLKRLRQLVEAEDREAWADV
jgi:RNA polymerase sigma-70 factor (ECF subfamily)